MKKNTLILLLSCLLYGNIYAQNTLIPDNNFEQALIDQGYDVAPLNGSVPTNNINAITSLDIDNLGIDDLTGIEDFIALTYLDVGQNNLTTVDVTQNVSLDDLRIDNNQLTAIDISQNTQLETLFIARNDLTSIDTSQNTLLSGYYCQFNQFTTLDVTQNINLTSLNCSYNLLTNLDLTQNVTLRSLTISDNQISTLDTSRNIALEDFTFRNNNMTSLDISQNVVLDLLSGDSNNLTTVDTSQNPILDHISLGSNMLTTMDVTANPLLEWCWIENNQLTTMDFSQNPGIRSLNVRFNALTSIALMPSNTITRYISLRGNQLGDNIIFNSFIGYPNLNRLTIQGNNFSGAFPDLTSLTFNSLSFEENAFQFGDFENQHVFYDTNIVGYDNDNQAKIDLEEIITPNSGDAITMVTNCSGAQNNYQWFKDNVALADNATFNGSQTNTLTLTNLQATEEGVYHCEVTSDIVTNFSIFRNDITLTLAAPPATTFVPDDNFEQRLIDLGYDIGPLDDYVPTNNINTVVSLSADNLNIADLTGIEDFIALVTLDVGQNQLTTVDLSQNIVLEALRIDNNQLATLNVTQNLLLNLLECYQNQLTTLDITQNPALVFLNAGNNQITPTIDTSQNLLLRRFVAGSNQINSLDLTLNTQLEYLAVPNNLLPALDVTQNLRLETINVSNNQIPNLNITQNILLESLSATSNLLTTVNTSLNTVLNFLFLDNNQITSMDLTQNTALTFCWIRNNQLPTLDVSQNINITSLNLSNNQLTALTIMPPNNTISYFAVGINQLTGNALPASLINYTNLGLIDLSRNQFNGPLPDFSAFNLSYLHFQNNFFEFGDFENQHVYYSNAANGIWYENEPQGKVNTEDTLNPCENQSVSLTATVSGSQNTYQWYKGIYEANSGPDLPVLLAGETNATLTFVNVQPADSGDYFCEINSNIVTNLTLIREPIHLNVLPNTIIANPVNDIFSCDANNDGFADFTIDIVDIENQVLGAQIGLPVSFFDVNDNPITLTNPYTNITANTQIITVVVGDPNGCFADTTFNLNALPAPNVPNLTNEIRCDAFTLPTLTNGNYYTATGGTGTQLNAGDIITTSQTVFIFENIGTAPNNCSDESSFTVTINQSPVVDILNTVTACDSYTLPALTTGDYFTMPNGLGTQYNAGDTITTTQTIYIFAQTATNPNCTDESNFVVTINTTPTIDLLADVTACDNYTLQPLTNGNYFTGSNGTGTQLNAGDTITTSQTIYIYAETGTTPNCSNENSFTVTLNTTPVVPVLQNETVCNSYILQPLTVGNYFTGTNGTGTQLNVSDVITTSQTIYIYAETATTPNCSDESSFTITINTSPAIDTLSNVNECSSYTLPLLANGTYYSGPNGTGTQLNTGDIITNSQTIYIYAESGTIPNCISESSFEVTIYPATDFSLTDTNLDINEQDVTVTMTDTSINYEYAIDSGSFQTNNDFFNLSEGLHTLYVRDENGCVEKSLTFEIVIIKFVVPKYFTPNSDGYHDTWQVIDTQNTIKAIHIFDRYGKLLKQISPTSQGWDGTYKGVLLAVNDYWYTIALHSGKVVRGHFTLKR